MLIADYIKKMQEIQEKHGNIEMFTNGEHGNMNPERLTIDVISVGTAENEVEDFEDFGLKKDDIVCYIGGY